MLHTIKLHGFLGKKYGKTVTLAGANMFQIMSGLISRFGHEFKEDVRVNNWHLVEGPRAKKKDIGEDELSKPLTEKTLHFIPAVSGASAELRVVIGVTLIVVGSIVPGMQWLVPVGITMAVGGVVEMMTKPPGADSQQNQEDNGSYIYNSAKNVTSQGGAIPLLFGHVTRASSVFISTDFSSDEVL